MCLFVTIRPELSENDCHKLATWLTTHSPFHVALGSQEFSQTLHFSLDPEEGCSCSILDEQADYNTDVWLFRNTIAGQLADTVALFAQMYPINFIFQALWDGDDCATSENISVDQMTAIIRNNQIRNNHCYSVAGK